MKGWENFEDFLILRIYLKQALVFPRPLTDDRITKCNAKTHFNIIIQPSLDGSYGIGRKKTKKTKQKIG